jgi:beta-alanine--pyruvate transaminase
MSTTRPSAHDARQAPETAEGLGAYWMPFTANRWFRRTPRLITGARGVHYRTEDGRELLDAASGLWCVNAGHCHPRIVEAVQRQAAEFDYAMAFQMGHPEVFRLAGRLGDMAPGDLDRVFFTNSGSEAADTALKIALAWHRIRGDAGRTRLIGRERGYHGSGFGGMSVGGIGGNRRPWPQALIPGVDHLPHTHDPEHMAFSRGQPEWGAHLADDLERRVALHGPGTIAAVIVEPVAGSGGVLVPPQGYLQRLRDLCTRHGILLIFDEVITGFRLALGGATERFGVTPDLATYGKAMAGGFPVAALAGRAELMERFASGVNHSGTFNASVMACAAVNAAVMTLSEDPPYERIERHSAAVQQGIRDLAQEHGVPLRVQGIGPAFHVSFGDDAPIHDFAELQTLDLARYSAFVPRLVDQGVWVTGRGIWYVSAAHGDAELTAVLERLDAALKAVTS